ncbi:MAG: hypothetical protein OXI46_09915 [Gemmatimonadota bacterium]|nr:hypothetical protein [Gemmatimonadota bacterium]
MRSDSNRRAGLVGPPWRETVTYRDIWPYEYVLNRKDSQRELVDAVVRVSVQARAAGRFFD